MLSRAENVLSLGDSSEEKTTNSPKQPSNLETMNKDDYNEVEIVPTSAKPFELLSHKCKQIIDLLEANQFQEKETQL